MQQIGDPLLLGAPLLAGQPRRGSVVSPCQAALAFRLLQLCDQLLDPRRVLPHLACLEQQRAGTNLLRVARRQFAQKTDPCRAIALCQFQHGSPQCDSPLGPVAGDRLLGGLKGTDRRCRIAAVCFEPRQQHPGLRHRRLLRTDRTSLLDRSGCLLGLRVESD